MHELREKLEQGVRYERGGALEKALAAYTAIGEAGAEDPALQAEAHRRRADVLRTRCEWEPSIEAARQSASLAREAGLDDLYAEALNAEAGVFQAQGRLDRARPLLEAGLERARGPRVRGILWQNLGFVAATSGEYEDAERCFRRSWECFRNAGYVRGEIIALINTGRAALDQGKVEAGIELCEQGLEAARRELDLDLAAVAAMNYADALLSLGRLDDALGLTSEAMGYFGTLPNRWRQVECLRLLGDIHKRAGEAAVAERCYRQGLSLALEVGARVEQERLEERLRSGEAE